jgi:hypothetical protein
MSPWATISRGDLPLVELPGDGVQACMPGRLDIPNDRKDVARELCRLHASHPYALHGASWAGVPSSFPRALAAARPAFSRRPSIRTNFQFANGLLLSLKNT